jgi:hypothetical protein
MDACAYCGGHHDLRDEQFGDELVCEHCYAALTAEPNVEHPYG